METVQNMNTLDLILIAILLISVIIGLIRGGVREILSIVGLALAIFLAFTFADKIGKDYISKFFDSPSISYTVAFTLIIIITILAVGLVNLLISQLLKASGLSFLNRFLGIVFGFIRGGVISSIIILVLGLIPGISSKDWWTQSKSVPILREVTDILKPYIPEKILKQLDTKDIKNKVKQKVQEILNNSSSDTDSTKLKKITKDIINSASETTKEQINQKTQGIINSATETNNLGLEPYDKSNDKNQSN